MSRKDNKALKPLRHAWSLHFDHEDYFLDEPITGHVELVIRDVYMAAKIQLTLTQFLTITVSNQTKKLSNAIVTTSVQLLTDAPRTQMCMGRHILPFRLVPDLHWNKLDKEGQTESKGDEMKSTLEQTPTSSQWMLPTTTWEHAEDVAVYTGTARSAQLRVAYVVECTSLCAVRGSVEQVVTRKEVKILGSVDPSTLHSPQLVGSYSPSGSGDQITFRAKLNRRTYHAGESISVHYHVTNNFSSPVKDIKFSLLNSAMLREPNVAVPSLHTECISSSSYGSLILPKETIDHVSTVEVPPQALRRWASTTADGTKLRLEPILRVALVLDNFQDHIFQTTLSISSTPRGLHDDAVLPKRATVELLGTTQFELSNSMSTSNGSSLDPHSAGPSVASGSTPPDAEAKRIIWVKDNDSAPCAHCSGLFSALHLKHHCRGCGLIVCSSHSKSMAAPKLFGLKPRRVCVTCEPLILSGALFSPIFIKNDDPAPVVRIQDEYSSSIQHELDSASSGLETVDLGVVTIPIKSQDEAVSTSLGTKPTLRSSLPSDPLPSSSV